MNLILKGWRAIHLHGIARLTKELAGYGETPDAFDTESASRDALAARFNALKRACQAHRAERKARGSRPSQKLVSIVEKSHDGHVISTSMSREAAEARMKASDAGQNYAEQRIVEPPQKTTPAAKVQPLPAKPAPGPQKPELCLITLASMTFGESTIKRLHATVGDAELEDRCRRLFVMDGLDHMIPGLDARPYLNAGFAPRKLFGAARAGHAEKIQRLRSALAEAGAALHPAA